MENPTPFSPTGNKNDMHGLFDQLEAFLEEYLVTKAPFQLPEGVKEFIVKVSPYIVLIMLILALPIVFAALGLSAIIAPFAAIGGGFYWSTFAVISLVFSALSIILEIIALPGLFKRTRKGWKFTFYAQVVSFIGGIISGGFSGLVSTLIGALIGAYFLFQVKSYYKN